MTKRKEWELTYIRERLRNLVALKDLHSLQWKAHIRKRKANIKEMTDPDANDFRTQVSATVKMQKDADLLSAQPEWTFIPLDPDARRNRKIAKYTWDYHWLITNTDETISEAIQSATTYWTWPVFDWIKHIRKTVKVPYYTEDEEWNPTWIEFKEEKKLTYSWIFSEKIPFENFFINWSNIKESTEAIVVRYFDKDEYIDEKLEDPSFDEAAIRKVKDTTWDFKPVSWTVWDTLEETTHDKTVMEIEYWNVAKDEYIVEANWIVVKNTPNPYPHKMLPFSLYLDNKGEDRIWWIWEFELLEQEERYKNELRTLLVRWVKSAIGMILKDRNADLEEDDMEFWIGATYETDDVNWIKQFAPNVPIWEISNAETKVDNDIIAKSWIDYKSQFLSPWETATKTAGKEKSAKKRINKNIKDNAYWFYRRLAEIRMANIQFLHSLWTKEIPIAWWSIDAEWVFSSEWEWFGSTTITKDLLKWNYLVMPIVETMLWDNKARRRTDAIQYTQLVWNMQNEDWTKPVKATQLARLITDEFDYDFEKLTEQVDTGKSWQDVLKDYKKQVQWTKWTPADENYTPPEQRNQAQWVPTLSWVDNSFLTQE